MSDTNPNLLERIANALLVERAPDVTPVYEHSWPLSTGLTVLAALLLAVGAFFIYTREKASASKLMRWTMAAMRSLALAIAIFMMYGWMLRQHRLDLPDLALVVDVSASMAAADAYQDQARRQRVEAIKAEGESAQPTRLDLAKRAFLSSRRPLIDELSERYNLKLYFVSGATTSQSGNSATEILSAAEATGEQSRLGDGLRSVLEFQRGRPTSSVILVTDGVTTAGQSLASAAEYARRISMPVFTIGAGDDQTPKDVRVGDLLVEEVAFAGDLIHFDFKIASSGYQGKSLRIRLHKQGDSRTLDEKTVTLGEDDVARGIRLSHREEEQGEFVFVVQADVLDKETNLENNSVSRAIQVREETIRVLLVQEYPSFDFRFLKTMLERRLKRGSQGEEKLIDLTTILQESDLDYSESDASAQRVFPVSRDELFSYDVIIFGDVDRSLFGDSTLQLIADFVRERGGGIVFIAGPRHTPLDYRDTPLADLMPFELSTAVAPPVGAILDETFEYRLQATRLGMSSPQLQVADGLVGSLRAWRDMPPMHFLLRTPDLRAGARVLLEHESKTGPNGVPLPLVTMQFAGAGKVIFHATDESYRWSRHEDGAEYYERYWLQTIRFLSRSRLLGADRGAELQSDRREYHRGESVSIRLRFLDERKAPAEDDGAVVVVEQEGGKRRQIRMSRGSIGRAVFEAEVTGLVDGRYRAWLATPTLDGQPPSTEFEIAPPLGEQARIQMEQAELARTAKLTGGKFYYLENLGGLLDDLPEGRKVRIESMPPEPVWNSNYLACLLVGLLVGEWLLRKRAGML